MSKLVITNGDSAAGLLEAAGLDGVILPWRDVLHEGPVIPGPLTACSAIRTPWLAARFGIEPEDVAEGFAERDDIMAEHARYEQIELWFEHDLYDQLQILQILDFLAAEDRTEGLVLVQADDFLGHQTPETVLRFAESARDLTDDDLATAGMLWQALAGGTPATVRNAIDAHDGPDFPYMAGALTRFLGELPAIGNGLSVTEAGMIGDLANAPARGVELFKASIAREEAAFMGDWSFFRVLDDLAICATPLVAAEPADPPGDDAYQRLVRASWHLTEAGRAVHAGEADHVALNGLDRWWAGTHLSGREVWRYDPERDALAPPGRPGA